MFEKEVLEEIKNYISSHLHEEITLGKISDAICYSQEHTSRFFKKQTGENLFDYIREQRLLKAAERLRNREGKIITTAFDSGFNSHEVFTRAFTSYFGLSPKNFRKIKPEIKQFMPKGLKAYPLENMEMNMETLMIYIQIMIKEERILLYYPGIKATHYFEYCDEVGCDVWGKLEEISGTLDEPAGLWLPEKFHKDGTSSYVQGVEVPLDYNKELPESLVSVVIPESSYLVFQSQPYEENDKKMMDVIQAVRKGIEDYDPGLHGYEWAEDLAPRYQLIPLGDRGYIEAVPIRKIK